MHIAHINLTDVREGISGAIRTLMTTQKSQGDDPVLFAMNRHTQNEDIFAITNYQVEWQRYLESFEKKEGLSGLSAGGIQDLWRQPQIQDADVIHLHVTSPAYFSYLLLPSLAAKPLVWSIYESQPFTAGCYHTAVCQRWRQQQCRECPLVSKEHQARQEELYLLKKAIYGITPMAVVTPNSWLTEQVKGSILASRFAAEIPVAIDPIYFNRVKPQEVKQRLDIPQATFVIAFSSPGGLTHPLFAGPLVRQLFDHWKIDNQQVLLLQIGSGESEVALPEPFVQRIIPYGLPPEQQNAVLQSADVFLQLSPHDGTAVSLLEASAAGLPSVAFPLAGAVSYIRHMENGYLCSSNGVEEVLKGVQFLRHNPDFSKNLGQQAAQDVWRRHQKTSVASAYQDVYKKAIQGSRGLWLGTTTNQVIPEVPRLGLDIEGLWEKSGIPKRVEQVLQKGPEEIWKDLDSCWSGFTKEREWERGVFIDLYLSYILSRARHPMQPTLLIEVIDQWLRRRNLPQRCGQFSPTEKIALQTWTKILRSSLEKFFHSTKTEFFIHLAIYQQGRLIELWRTLFFNDFTTPYLEEDMHREARRQAEATTSSKRLYPDLLIRSMYSPYPPEAIKLDMGRLLKRDVPIALQVILGFWLVNVPYFDGDEKRQRIMRRNVTEFLESAMQDPETLPQNFFAGVTEHFVPQFWRSAYLGGNLVAELSLFGDFLHQQMRRFYPSMVDPIAPRPLQETRKLRIGYFSTNFFYQAVSYYMANRIFFADKRRFEVQVFSLERVHDAMTDRIKAYSDRFTVFSDYRNLAGMAETIKKSELDMLIFADIGMDQITYQLAAMRLAPVQCVLVGHGVTTGLPTIDHYISGDFEGSNADSHYRENLVRLPNLGAAQLPPPALPTGKLTRQSLGIPEDVVLLVSCANGIKHGPERDELFVRILQQAPQAMIVLKPFMTSDLIQPQWMRRVQEAARQGGVESRLRILPPLAQNQDMMDFLIIGDIQLDSYPYGGWTTNMEAVYAGLAIVTQEGEQARSRWGAHILRALGVRAGIANNADEYVEQAVELVNNKDLRQQVRQQISERAITVLFNGKAAQPAYETELIRIHEMAVADWAQRKL